MKKTLAIVRIMCFTSYISADVESYCKSCKIGLCMLSKMWRKFDYSLIEPSRKDALRLGRSRTETEAFRRDRPRYSIIGSRVNLRKLGIKCGNKVQDVYDDMNEEDWYDVRHRRLIVTPDGTVK